MRSVTNPSSIIDSPTIPRNAQVGTSAAPSQPELEADQTLQTEEGSTTVERDRTAENPVIRSPPHSPRASRSRRSTGVPLTEISKTVIQNNRKGKAREHHLFYDIPHLKHADAYDETLSESLTRCHHPWDPMEDDDPLTEYGAEEGKLPGLTLEQSMPIRDIVLRWIAPHQYLVWTSLEDYTNLFCGLPLEVNSVQLRMLEGESYYALITTILLHAYEVVLGITQILAAIDELLARSPRKAFHLDKGYIILKQLARGIDENFIHISFYTLQSRCKGMINHVRQSLNAIREMFNHYGDVYSTRSYNSTFSNIRSEYGQLTPRLEIVRHALREDYRRTLPCPTYSRWTPLESR